MVNIFVCFVLLHVDGKVLIVGEINFNNVKVVRGELILIDKIFWKCLLVLGTICRNLMIKVVVESAKNWVGHAGFKLGKIHPQRVGRTQYQRMEE